jgi:hypothetical protein
MVTDNRMQWIRNLEALPGAREPYAVEYELGSECYIPGLLDYADGSIICAPMGTEASRDGLWLYNLILRFPTGHRTPNWTANKKGYYFKDGILGELRALLSVFFRCRFYLLSSSMRPTDARLGVTIKTDYPFIRVRCNPGIHPPVFESANKNLAEGFSGFLDRVKLLDHTRHQNFILACHHYSRAVREVGVDPEMVFIRLVSAIETLSQDTKLTRKEDVLEQQKIVDLIAHSKLSAEYKSELQSIFDVRKSRKKFVRFVEEHCKGFFKGGNVKGRHLKIKKVNLPKILNIIYIARSKYLHGGEPMFLSTPLKGGEKWDFDPVISMIADNRSLSATQKLPYGYFFEGLVRHCLLNYLVKHSSDRTETP